SDDAARQQLVRRAVDADLAGPHPFGQQAFHLPHAFREQPARIWSVGGNLAHPRELNAEFVAEAVKYVRVDPTQRIDLFDGRGIRTQYRGPAHGDLLAKRLHDRRQQLVLRPDQPVDRPGAESCRGRNVADGRDLISLAAEFRSGDSADVRRLAVGLALAVVDP